MTQVQIMHALYPLLWVLLPFLSKRQRYMLASDWAMALHSVGWRVCNPRKAWEFRLMRRYLRDGRWVIWA